MKFAVKTVTCLGCRTPLKSNKGKSRHNLESCCVTGSADPPQRVQSASTVAQNCRSSIKNRQAISLLDFAVNRLSSDLTQVVQTSALQIDFARLWTQCQRCQGSLHQDVICTSADCPIYYRRTARQKEVSASVAQLDRFEKEQTW